MSNLFPEIVAWKEEVKTTLMPLREFWSQKLALAADKVCNNPYDKSAFAALYFTLKEYKQVHKIQLPDPDNMFAEDEASFKASYEAWTSAAKKLGD